MDPISTGVEWRKKPSSKMGRTTMVLSLDADFNHYIAPHLIQIQDSKGYCGQKDNESLYHQT